ncbi:serine/threonine protein kinase, partial [Penicillium macrosclerotiorum]|uniref:serine/threonine protein kinase n=1 Tax=Penicillium macrosclerotiorum TaxID=303699 RepID=UPI002546A74C
SPGKKGSREKPSRSIPARDYSLAKGGGISFVYEVHPLIVVKVPKSGQEEKEQFHKELKIYEILSRNSPCPSLV